MRMSSLAREEALGEARTITSQWDMLSEMKKRQIVEAITSQIIIDKDDIEIKLLQLQQSPEHVAKGQRDDAAWSAARS